MEPTAVTFRVLARIRPVRRALCAVLLAVVVLTLTGARADDPPPVPPWESALGRTHPLAARIWQPATGTFVTPGALVANLRDARFVLLGEKHDNADSHRLQAWVLAALVAAGRRPAVAFEMMSVDDDVAIAQAVAAHPDDPVAIARAVDWARSGWPDFALYAPVVRVALDAKLPIVGANLSPRVTQAVRRGGLAALDPAVRVTLGVDRPLPTDAGLALFTEIRRAHCDALPDESIERMVDVQRARDGQMAEAMVRAVNDRGGDGAVLIAGTGHVRNDRGVPWSLRRRVPGAGIASLALLEVRDADADPASYTRDGLHDALWFTARVDDRDPCEAFRAPQRPGRLDKPAAAP
jgi:uncharacterized iron-regulated protein